MDSRGAPARSPSSGEQFKYDVFISFRGADTRNTFMSHLHAALVRQGIQTFVDKGIKRPELISQSIMKAIEESRISIVIFSKNYATSSWCLDELVKILDCRAQERLTVLPVFYGVEPSDLVDQSGRLGDLFLDCFADKLLRWRAALKELSQLSGWISGDTRPESLLVNDIATHISKKLHQRSYYFEGLVGIDSRAEQLQSLLLRDSFDIRTIGIWGMGGMGKTTLSKFVYHKIQKTFENHCFFGSVGRNLGKPRPADRLKEFPREILGDETDSTDDLCGGLTSIAARFRNKKVLMVLDDVFDTRDFRSLIGLRDQFGQGSRIIVTSRDRQVLISCGADDIYKVQALNNHESLQLFSHYVFRDSSPSDGFWDLSKRVIAHAKGLPLALKIFGSHLFAKSFEEWENILHQWKSVPDGDILNVLQVSYSKLNGEEKDIFLHIACFFRGQSIDYVKQILNGCGFDADVGIASLVDKSLISISDKRVEMHNLVQQMGRQIVRQESISELGSRSRLWDSADIYHVLTNNKGTGAVRGINLDVAKIGELFLNSDAFTNLQNLRLLKIYDSFSNYWEDDCKLHASEGLRYLPASPRLLHWDRYPLESLPSNFKPEKLVELNMCNSNVEMLWEGVQCLARLKRINLSHCKRLLKLPDFSESPNLEIIILEGCSSLTEIHSSIGRLKKLAVLNLKDCIKLMSLSITVHLVSLHILKLSGCSKLKMLSGNAANIKNLSLDGTAIGELPQSIQHLNKLSSLYLNNCKRLSKLPAEFCKLQSLKIIGLSGCSKLESFPEIFEPMNNLEVLWLDGTAIREVPRTREMNKIKILSFSDCNLSELPDTLCRLSSLEQLNLRGNNFFSLPSEIKQLVQLKFLDISSCCNLKSLPELPSHVEYVNAHDCASLESVSIPSSVLTVSEWNRPMFLFTNCFKLDSNRLLGSTFIDDQGPALLPSAGICFPGSKIPEQITHQSAGSSLSVQLPVHLFDGRVRGFSLGAVLGFKDVLDNHGFSVKCSSKLRTKHEDTFCSQRDFIICHGRSGHWKNSRILGSDHVFLGFNFSFNLMESQGGEMHDNEMHNESYHATALFEFYVVDSMGRPLHGCEVRECGFSLALAEDENEYTPSYYY